MTFKSPFQPKPFYDISFTQASPVQLTAFTRVQPNIEAKSAPRSLPEGRDDKCHQLAPCSGNQVPHREPCSPSIQDSHRSCLRGGQARSLLAGTPAREAARPCQAQDSQEAEHGLGSTEGQAGDGCTLGGHVRDRQTDQCTHTCPAFPPAFIISGFAPSSALAAFASEPSWEAAPTPPQSPSHHLPPLLSGLS